MDHPRIVFLARYAGEEYHIESYKGEYKNLMELMKDKIYPDGFGECGGMGRCGTCLVCLPDAIMPNSTVRNEATTLSKMKLESTTFRLSCQIVVDDALQDMTISILEDY